MKKTKYGFRILVLFLALALVLGNCKSAQKADENGNTSENTTEEGTNNTTDSGSESTDNPTTRNLDPSETEKGSLPDGSEEETEKKESMDDGKLTRGSEAETTLVNTINEQIKDWRYPDGSRVSGFGYKSTSLPSRTHFRSWISEKKPVIEKAMKKLRNGYKLEITGHADASGPDEAQPEIGKKGNIYYSKERAESMKQALVREGFPAERIVTKGVGSQELLPNVDSRSAKNRRVTFQLRADD